MTADEIDMAAVRECQAVASMAAEHTSPENPGATALAIMISAYSLALAEYMKAGVMTLEQALSGVRRDFDIIESELRKVTP
jgi:hypothetical protein